MLFFASGEHECCLAQQTHRRPHSERQFVQRHVGEYDDQSSGRQRIEAAIMVRPAAVFLNVTPCGFVDRYQRLEGTCCLRSQSSYNFFTLTILAVISS